jgi:hypothetical protein
MKVLFELKTYKKIAILSIAILAIQQVEARIQLLYVPILSLIQ